MHQILLDVEFIGEDVGVQRGDIDLFAIRKFECLALRDRDIHADTLLQCGLKEDFGMGTGAVYTLYLCRK